MPKRPLPRDCGADRDRVFRDARRQRPHLQAFDPRLRPAPDGRRSRESTSTSPGTSGLEMEGEGSKSHPMLLVRRTKAANAPVDTDMVKLLAREPASPSYRIVMDFFSRAGLVEYQRGREPPSAPGYRSHCFPLRVCPRSVALGLVGWVKPALLEERHMNRESWMTQVVLASRLSLIHG